MVERLHGKGHGLVRIAQSHALGRYAAAHLDEASHRIAHASSVTLMISAQSPVGMRSSGPYGLRESTLWGYAWAAGAQMGVWRGCFKIPAAMMITYPSR